MINITQRRKAKWTNKKSRRDKEKMNNNKISMKEAKKRAKNKGERVLI